MGLVNTENRIKDKLCEALKQVVKREKCGDFNDYEDEKLIKLSIVDRFWKTWDSGQIDKLDTFLFKN